MNADLPLLTRTWCRAVALMGLACCLAATPPALAERNAQDEDARPDSSQTPAPVAPSRMIFIDPATGELLPGPPEGEKIHLGNREQEMLSRSSFGLFEKESPAGGFYVDLEGRFRNFTIATVGPDGSVRTRCVGVPAAPAEPGSEQDLANSSTEPEEESP